MTCPVLDTGIGVAYVMVDEPDLCSLFVLPAALVAAVEWLLSSVHIDVHFKERKHDALVHVETTSSMSDWKYSQYDTYQVIVSSASCYSFLLS
jgi:hypothetical protein